MTAPFGDLEAALPREARILDVGCGHGVLSLYLAACDERRQVLGVDVDDAKIALARAAAARSNLGGSVDFEVVDPRWLPAPESIDAAVVSDVLYVLGADRVEALLHALAAAVVPGGVVVVQETATTPRWRFRMARLQELVSIRLLRLTRAATVDFVAAGTVETMLSAAGMDVTTTLLSGRRLHVQYVVVARRP